MYIKEVKDAWRMTFFPEATDTDKNDSWQERGFRVQYGTTQGVSVPKYIEYDKRKFTRFEAEEYAKNIRSCQHCKRLNNDVDVVQTVELMDTYPKPATAVAGSNAQESEIAQLKADFAVIKAKVAASQPTRKSATQELASQIAMDMFKTNFTDAGRIELALIFDDDSFIDDLLPQHPTEEDVMTLRAGMADFWAGDIGRYRTPDQLREYAKMQRNNIRALRGEPIDEDEEEIAKVVKKKKKTGQGSKVRVV